MSFRHIVSSCLATICLCAYNFSVAQNVGIGTQNPSKRLSVNGSLLVDQNNTNAGILDSAALLFGTSTGVGIFSNRAVQGINTNGMDFWTNSQRRLIITSAGYVGIGLGNAAPSVMLDVQGGIRSRTQISSDNSIYAQYDIIAYGQLFAEGNGTVHGYLGVGTNPDASYRLKVNGNALIQTNLTATGTITAGGSISVGGKGIVKSNNGTQLRMGFSGGNFVLTLPAGGSADVSFTVTPFSGTNTNIRVSVCQFIPDTGTGDTWDQFVVTVHSVNPTTDQCTVRFFNAGNTTATIDGTLYLLCVVTD